MSVMQEAVNKAKQREAELQESCTDLREENRQYRDKMNAYSKLVHDHSRLVDWYEKLIREVPVIRKKNSTLFWQQTWDSALTDYIEQNCKPVVNKI